MLRTVYVTDGVKKEVQRWDKVSWSHRQVRSHNTPTHAILLKSSHIFNVNLTGGSPITDTYVSKNYAIR